MVVIMKGYMKSNFIGESLKPENPKFHNLQIGNIYN